MKNIDPYWIAADWPAPENIHAGVTTRLGGVSRAPYASLNLADHVDDEPASVVRNRKIVRKQLALPQEPAWLRQAHGNRVIKLPADVKNPEADGSYTRTKNQVCAILTADCLPLLLCAADGSEIAAIHTGWRGYSKNIIAQALAMFTARPKDILGWMGPYISADHYETGTEVRAACIKIVNGSSSAFRAGRPGHWFTDLGLLVRQQLLIHGVDRIYGGNHCNWTDHARFYSYRREGNTGRMASLIWIN